MKRKFAELINNIMKPSKEYTPIPFWFYNDKPDEGYAEQTYPWRIKGNDFLLTPSKKD